MTTRDVTPSAARLIGSLRDIGYDLNTAIADLVDNSIAADARQVDIEVRFDGLNSTIVVADDGFGMTATELDEALRFGTRRTYGSGDLGRFGLGLKTSALSQGRVVTVVTRAAPRNRRLSARSLDLDHIAGCDRWEILDLGSREAVRLAEGRLDGGPGTVIRVSRLDRVLPRRDPEGGWARRRFAQLAERLRDHLGMVFHRFLAGEAAPRVIITVNGEKVHAWDPFARDEEATESLPIKVLRLDEGAGAIVRFRPYVLPSRRRFSSLEAFERASGPRRWNRQQGLYIYRADRLIQSGGWSGLRAADEHTKLARAALEFDTDADEAFRINVAKMRVSLPAELRPVLERPVQELCNRANRAYRVDSDRRPTRRPLDAVAAGGEGLKRIGAALLAAAAREGQTPALMRIMDRLAKDDAEIASTLGWLEV